VYDALRPALGFGHFPLYIHDKVVLNSD
jgi:hypothetical protein